MKSSPKMTASAAWSPWLTSPESGLKLFGYMAPGNRYEGIYLMDKDSRVNAFPTAVYATDALICPTISWDKETSTLTVTVLALRS